MIENEEDVKATNDKTRDSVIVPNVDGFMIVPSLLKLDDFEKELLDKSTNFYYQTQQEYNSFQKDELHDIRYLLSHPLNKTNETSLQYEEFLLSNKQVYNWYQIREALKHDSKELNETQNNYSRIEDANIFNPPSEEDENLHLSLPLTIEYWRRRQREIQKSNNSSFHNIIVLPPHSPYLN
ncbi:hypothetical protein ABK040_003455 [Willaertia magna]